MLPLLLPFPLGRCWASFIPPALTLHRPVAPSLWPQWHQWLHKAREEPPTEEDIQRGIHQRELYRQRIAEIEREEAQRSFQARSGGGRAGGGFTQQLPGEKD